MRITFADCVFDSDRREVLRKGTAVALTPKAFELLDLLIRNRPNVLPKERIHESLWPKTFVSDASLSNLVAELRAVLGDDAREPHIVRTVHRFGYSFQADAKSEGVAASSGAAYRLLWETREIDLRPGENVFGRDHNALVWIDDAAVSRRHARIVVEPNGTTLEDLGSKNGTLRNGELVRGAEQLEDGDQIQVGRATMTFRVLQQTGSTQTASGLRRSTKPRKSTP